MRHNVVLIGFMGTGKSVVGRAIASRLGLAFVDTDALVEARDGRSIARIFAEDGEPAFRRLESDAAAAAGERRGAVIATGGGIVLNAENMARLRRHGMVVALRATPAAILARVGNGAERPLLGADPEARVRQLLDERGALYDAADLVVDTTDLSPDDIARCVGAFATTWNGARPEPVAGARVPVETVRVQTGARGYDVRIGTGLLGGIGAELRRCGIGGKVAVLTHPRLRALYGEALLSSLAGEDYEVTTVEVPPTEASKSLRVAARVYDALLAARMDRASALVVLGGGVAGDLGGFVAATFLRGIAWAAVPTTLLGQVDAAIGGKTAVNHPRGKNLIGAVHQPALVVADIETLGSLPAREVRSGMAEVIKTGFIGAPDLIAYLEEHIDDVLQRHADALARVVARCAAYKARIVAGDEREEAGRIVLNYGHTIGHGIEAAAGYRGITHGEAVAVGMTLEAAIACRLGVCDAALVERQTALLRRAGLPTGLGQLRLPPALRAESVAEAMTRDKKARAGRLRFVLPVGVGETVVRDDVPAGLLTEVLAGG